MLILTIAVVVFSILWVFVRPDLWGWVLSYAISTILMLLKASRIGMDHGFDIGVNSQKKLQNRDLPDEASIAKARLEAFQNVAAEAELFAYELEHGLIPDGDSEHNRGYGPMDFDEWREWKQREFELTGNLWHNHPNGVPPKEGNAA